MSVLETSKRRKKMASAPAVSGQAGQRMTPCLSLTIMTSHWPVTFKFLRIVSSGHAWTSILISISPAIRSREPSEGLAFLHTRRCMTSVPYARERSSSHNQYYCAL